MNQPRVVRGAQPARNVTVIDADAVDVSPLVMESEPDLSTTRMVATAANKIGAKALEPEILRDVADTYPEDDIDPEIPLDEDVLLLAGSISKMLSKDTAKGRMALSLGMKHNMLHGNLHKFDKKAVGLRDMALESIAGQRHGFKRSRLMYRKNKQTWWERIQDWGHNPKIKNHWVRLLYPGGTHAYTDLSYWVVQRSCWVNIRPKDGMVTFTQRPEIPTDAPPEDTCGDHWCIWEGMPQRRIAEPGKQIVKTDADLLCTTLGHRAPRSFNMIEWVHHMKEKTPSSAQKREKEKKEGTDAASVAAVDLPWWKQFVYGSAKVVGVVTAMIVVFALFIILPKIL